jgi:hypothetical protein
MPLQISPPNLHSWRASSRSLKNCGSRNFSFFFSSTTRSCLHIPQLTRAGTQLRHATRHLPLCCLPTSAVARSTPWFVLRPSHEAERAKRPQVRQIVLAVQSPATPTATVSAKAGVEEGRSRGSHRGAHQWWWRDAPAEIGGERRTAAGSAPDLWRCSARWQ